MKTLYAQIYLQVISYHRNKIKWFCYMARTVPHLRNTMLAQAKAHAQEIKNTLRDWRLSYPMAN